METVWAGYRGAKSLERVPGRSQGCAMSGGEGPGAGYKGPRNSVVCQVT